MVEGQKEHQEMEGSHKSASTHHVWDMAGGGHLRDWKEPHQVRHLKEDHRRGRTQEVEEEGRAWLCEGGGGIGRVHCVRGVAPRALARDRMGVQDDDKVGGGDHGSGERQHGLQQGRIPRQQYLST